MKLRFRTTVCSMLTAIVSGLPIQAEEFIIRTDRPGAEIQPTMYGLFFEDINYAADGGLYAEMVKNRSFEFPQNLMGWESFGAVALLDDGPFDRNPHYVRLSAAPHKDKATGLTNEGGYIVKIANTSDSPKDITLNFQKLRKGRSRPTDVSSPSPPPSAPTALRTLTATTLRRIRTALSPWNPFFRQAETPPL